MAATTMTPVFPSKPSISDSSWLMVCVQGNHFSKRLHFRSMPAASRAEPADTPVACGLILIYQSPQAAVALAQQPAAPLPPTLPVQQQLTCSRSSLPPPMPDPRCLPTASISSMKTMQGALVLACTAEPGCQDQLSLGPSCRDMQHCGPHRADGFMAQLWTHSELHHALLRGTPSRTGP